MELPSPPFRLVQLIALGEIAVKMQGMHLLLASDSIMRYNMGKYGERGYSAMAKPTQPTRFDMGGLGCVEFVAHNVKNRKRGIRWNLN